MIKHGSTRIVFLIGDYAIKIPSFTEYRLFLLGLLANMQEAKFSKTGWPELCPVLFSIPFGFMTVMKRARPLTIQQYARINFEKWIERDEYVIPVEIKKDSFGWIEGKLVVVDYGN